MGFGKAVLGVSGGVDSAVALLLATRALGPQCVVGVMMPYATSDPASRKDALSVAEVAGVELMERPITTQIDAYFAKDESASRARRGNKMARERMSILYDLSAENEALVVGTSNKTELLLGYGTIFGDLASALNPLGDLYKTQVFALASALGVPESIVNKPPSADLWEGQSDEADLGFSYAMADSILYLLVDVRWTVDEIVGAGFDSALVAGIMRTVRINQYKRRLPLIAKLGPRTIDRDFRYPRDWGA